MRSQAKQPRENRPITVDFHDETTYVRVLDEGKACLEFVLAFLLSLGFQLPHQATWSGGRGRTRHAPYGRVRLGGISIGRVQGTRGQAVFTGLPHCVLRYRQMRPEVARQALLATHGGLSLALGAVICHISPLAL